MSIEFPERQATAERLIGQIIIGWSNFEVAMSNEMISLIHLADMLVEEGGLPQASIPEIPRVGVNQYPATGPRFKDRRKAYRRIIRIFDRDGNLTRKVDNIFQVLSPIKTLRDNIAHGMIVVWPHEETEHIKAVEICSSIDNALKRISSRDCGASRSLELSFLEDQVSILQKIHFDRMGVYMDAHQVGQSLCR